MAKIWYVGFIWVNELKPKVLALLDDPPSPPPALVLNQILFGSAFFSLCNGYFRQTQSLPKLNTLDLSLVIFSNTNEDSMIFVFDFIECDQ